LKKIFWEIFVLRKIVGTFEKKKNLNTLIYLQIKD